MKSKKVESEIFVWEWNEWPPLASIVKKARNLDAEEKPYIFDLNGSTSVLLFAKSRREAKKKIEEWLGWPVRMSDFSVLTNERF